MSIQSNNTFGWEITTGRTYYIHGGTCNTCGCWPCRCWYSYPGNCITLPIQNDTAKQAFGLAKKMVEEKIIKVDSVKRFIELVELIEKEL